MMEGKRKKDKVKIIRCFAITDYYCGAKIAFFADIWAWVRVKLTFVGCKTTYIAN